MRYLAAVLFYALGLVELVVRAVVVLALILLTFSLVFLAGNPLVLMEDVVGWDLAERLLSEPSRAQREAEAHRDFYD